MKDSLDFPELLFRLRGNELSLNVERLHGIDQGSTHSISALAILFDTVFVHAVRALRLGVAVSAFARVSSHLESVLVSLHDVNAGAHGLGGHHVHFRVASTFEGDGVSSGDTSAISVAEVDFVLECSTLHDRLVGVLFSFHGHVLHVGDLVVGDGHFLEHFNCDRVAFLVAVQPEGSREVIFFTDEEVEGLPIVFESLV